MIFCYGSTGKLMWLRWCVKLNLFINVIYFSSCFHKVIGSCIRDGCVGVYVVGKTMNKNQCKSDLFSLSSTYESKKSFQLYFLSRGLVPERGWGLFLIPIVGSPPNFGNKWRTLCILQICFPFVCSCFFSYSRVYVAVYPTVCCFPLNNQCKAGWIEPWKLKTRVPRLCPFFSTHTYVSHV